MLSKRGIDKLEKIMLANKKYYHQMTFGTRTECGTLMCAAGFCRLIEVGKKEFEREISEESDFLPALCKNSGAKLLGIKRLSNDCGIFGHESHWPNDLCEKFEKLKTPLARVRFYIKMLRTRVNDDGSIRE
jgi:hypothetical protein